MAHIQAGDLWPLSLIPLSYSGRPDGWTVVGVPGWKDDGQRKLGAYWERRARQKQGKRATPTIPITVRLPACSSTHGGIHTQTHTHTHDTHMHTQNHLQTNPTMHTNTIFATQALDKKKWRNEETIIIGFNTHLAHALILSSPAHPQNQPAKCETRQSRVNYWFSVRLKCKRQK